jgi:hypothetical protein
MSVTTDGGTFKLLSHHVVTAEVRSEKKRNYKDF